jgi:hypothetical protein
MRYWSKCKKMKNFLQLTSIALQPQQHVNSPSGGLSIIPTDTIGVEYLNEAGGQPPHYQYRVRREPLFPTF